MYGVIMVFQRVETINNNNNNNEKLYGFHFIFCAPTWFSMLTLKYR